MGGVASLLAAAAIAYLLARLLRSPAVPLLLVGGLGLSVVASPPDDVLESALLLGVSFLLFVAGLELDPRRIRAQRRAVLQVGLAQFAVLGVLGFLAARGLGYRVTEASYVALALPASSTLVCVRLLQRRRQMFEPFGRLTLGVLLLQDVLVLLAIPVVMGTTTGWRHVLLGLGGVTLLGVTCLVVRRWAGPLLLRVADETELVLLSALAILFAFLGAARVLGLPMVVGAFLAGAALSRFPVNGIVRSVLAPVGDFFTALFFTALGALVRVPTAHELAHGAVLAVLLLVVTPPLVAVIAQRAGFPTRTAIEAGLILSQASEMSLVVGLAGMIQGHIDQSLFVVIAFVTATTMLLTAFISTDDVARRLMHLRRRRPPEVDRPPSDHVLLLGAGSTGMPLLEDLVIAGCPVAVVDDDSAVIARLAGAEVRAILGEASDPLVLRAAGADRARVVSSTIRRPRDNAALLAMAEGIPVLVRVFDHADAVWVRDRGGEPVLYPDAAADGLMEWYAAREAELDQDALARGAGGPGGGPVATRRPGDT